MLKGTNQSPLLLLEPECLRTLKLDRSSPLSLGRQLYLSLYEAISCGALPTNSVLPATRTLATNLGIARNTVVAAYTQLSDELLVTSEGGRSTRVIYAHQSSDSHVSAESSITTIPTLSRRSPLAQTSERFRELTPGEPDSSLFPERDWQRAMARAARLPASELGYRTQGQTKLQLSIARHLAVYRSLVVEPSRIILTSSTRQSLLLAATMYADVGDRALMETPGYPGAVDAFRALGLELIGCDIDPAGAQLIEGAMSAKLAYLTPCFQYPLGMPLSAERRDTFLSLSRDNGTVLFEDDYDSEFRDQSQPHPALAAQAELHDACVLHAGTFSKLVFPSARVAWVVVPEVHIDIAWRCLHTLGGGHGVIAQTAICELLDTGSISRHLRRARQIYAQRREVLNQCIDRSDVIMAVDGGGLTTVLTLKKRYLVTKLETELASAQLGARPLECFKWERSVPRFTRHLVIGMGNVDSMALPDVIKRLEAALKQSG